MSEISCSVVKVLITVSYHSFAQTETINMPAAGFYKMFTQMYALAV